MTRKLKTILILAILMRVVFAFSVWHPDLNNHIDWGIRFFEYGPAKYFAPETNVWSFTWPNQPPGTIYMFAGARILFEWLFSFFWFLNVKISVFPSGIITFFEKALYPAILQLPAILADFGIAWVIYKVVKKMKNEKLAISGALIYLFNPVVWYNSSVWGQYDSVINFFALLSFYLLMEKKLKWAILFFALSIYTKASLLIFAPIFLLVALKRFSFKKVISSSFLTIVAIGLATLPFSSGEPFSWLYNLYNKKIFVQQLHVITANAFNLWAGIAGIHERPDSLMLGPLAYKTWGTLLFAVSYIPALFVVWKKKSGKAIFWALSIVAFSSFMLMTNMHERYLYPLFPVLTILMVQDKSLRKIYWGIVIISLLNLYNFWWTPRIDLIVNFLSFGDRLMPRILGFVNFGFFVYLYRYFLRQNKAI